MLSETPQATVELAPDYYHQNFCQLLTVVQQRYGDLLTVEEQDFLQQFYAASMQAQCLYVRLSGRSKSLFRLSKLQYQEIPDLHQAATQLDALGLLSINPALELAEMLPLFTKPELTKLLNPKGASKLKREALEQQLIEQAEQAMIDTLANADTLLAVLQEQHLPVFRLCFFGNLYQDLSEFVLRDLAIFQFESYSLDSQSRQFSDRTQLEQHLQYYACTELSEDAMTLGSESILALSQALPEPRPDDHALLRRVERFRNRLARELERQKDTELALTLYSLSTSSPARERCARIHMSDGKIDQSLALCREILNNPNNEAESVFAQQFGQRHAKRHDRPWPSSERVKPQEQLLHLPQTKNVEADTAAHLSQFGDCFFVENTLFSSVLGLAIWPAVFAPIKGAFSHPFQYRPHDFYDADFQQQRAHVIESALQLQLQDSAAFEQQLLSTFRSKFGLSNPLVFWSYLTEELLGKALKEIPVAHWQLIFQRLLADLRNHRNGLPDLIQFPHSGGYELVEVKGPGDRLQENQKRWMHFFHQHDIPHWVAQVRWLESTDDA